MRKDFLSLTLNFHKLIKTSLIKGVSIVLHKVFWLLIVFIFSQSLEARSKVITLALSAGIQKDIKIPKAPRGFLKGGKYKSNLKLQYNPRTKILRFIPTKTGFGTLLIIHPRTRKILYSFRYNIRKTDIHIAAKEIKNLLRDIEGIKVKILNNRVVVDGQILLPKDMNRIHSVVKQYGDIASSLVTLSPIAQKKIAKLIERAINNPEVQVRAVNGKYILEGIVNTEQERNNAILIARTYAPEIIVKEAVTDKKILEWGGNKIEEIIINMIQVRSQQAPSPPKMVQIVIHYVELNKSYTRGFRFQWMPDLDDGSGLKFSSGENSAGGIVSSITGVIRNLLPKLNWAKSHGHARVLQSSTLIVQEGKKGIIKSNNDIPYQAASPEGQAVTQFKEVGINTTVTPQIVGERADSINLNLNFSISNFIGNTSSGPLTSKKNIETTIIVRSGQSAAVGGLINNTQGNDYNRLPANVSQNPIFSLYASKEFRRNQSQFVVFVTPIIKLSASDGAKRIKRKFRIKD